MEKVLPATKNCIKCGQNKRADQFLSKPFARDGLSAKCSDCSSDIVFCPDCGKIGSKYGSSTDPNTFLGNPPRCQECRIIRRKESIRQHNKRRAQAKGQKKHSKAQWLNLLQYYCPEGRCLACGEVKPLEKDHVIPLSKNGVDTIDNIQPICHECNMQKYIKIIDYRPDQGAFARRLECPCPY